MDVREIANELAKFISNVGAIPIADVDSVATLRELGVDSATSISLAAHIEEQYGLSADEEIVLGAASIWELAQLIDQNGRK
jgi:acyl carrier protein